MTYIRNAPVGEMGHIEDTTDVVWTEILSWPCWFLDKKTLILENTDKTNSLLYRVLVRVTPGELEVEEVSQRTLPPGEKARISLNNRYARIRVEVVDVAQGDHATVELDWIGQP
jgi:hypothetical protein